MDIDIMKMDREIREERINKLKDDRHYCVYVHTCRDNGKMYVGMTGRDPKVRWGCNGSGYKSQTVFWRAIQSHGWDNFDHEIVASNITEQEARALERKLINELDLFVNDGNGYNLVPGGRYNGHYINRCVCQFTVDGKFVNEYRNITEAARLTGFKHGGIFHACNKTRVTYMNYIWRYSDEVDDVEMLKKEMQLYRTTKKESGALARAESRLLYTEPLYQFDLQNNLIASYNNVRDIIVHNGRDKCEYYRSIIDVCGERKGRKTFDNSIWKFQKDVPDLQYFKETYKLNYKPQIPYSILRKVVQFDLNGNYIAHYDMVRSAVRAIGGIEGSTDSKIVAVCRGKRNIAYGYKWKYLEDCSPELIEQIKKEDDLYDC